MLLRTSFQLRLTEEIFNLLGCHQRRCQEAVSDGGAGFVLENPLLELHKNITLKKEKTKNGFQKLIKSLFLKPSPVGCNKCC